MPTALLVEAIRLLPQNQPFFKGKHRRLDRSTLRAVRIQCLLIGTERWRPSVLICRRCGTMASPAAQHPVRLDGPCICGSQKLFKDCCGYGTAGSRHERRCSSSNPNFFGVSVIEPPCFIQFVGSPPEPTRAPRRLATHPNALAARSAPRVLVPA